MGLQQILGLKNYTTAWTWLHKICTAMVNPNRTKLSGTVEVDEYYIGSEEHGGKRGLLFYRLIGYAMQVAPTTQDQLFAHKA